MMQSNKQLRIRFFHFPQKKNKILFLFKKTKHGFFQKTQKKQVGWVF